MRVPGVGWVSLAAEYGPLGVFHFRGLFRVLGVLSCGSGWLARLSDRKGRRRGKGDGKEDHRRRREGQTKRSGPRRRWGDGPRQARENEKGGGRRRQRKDPSAQAGNGQRKNPRSEPAGERSNYTKNSFCKASRCPCVAGLTDSAHRNGPNHTKRVFCTNCGRVVYPLPAPANQPDDRAPCPRRCSAADSGCDGAGWIVRAAGEGRFPLAFILWGEMTPSRSG